MYPGITVTARQVTERLARPEGRVTNAAPTTRAALAVRVGKSTRDRIWGSLPTEEVEGHTPDPAYDVRPIEGLGRAPVRSERLGLGFSRELLDQVDEARARAVARPSGLVDAAAKSPQPELDQALAAALPSPSSSMLLPLAALAGILFLLKRR